MNNLNLLTTLLRPQKEVSLPWQARASFTRTPGAITACLGAPYPSPARAKVSLLAWGQVSPLIPVSPSSSSQPHPIIWPEHSLISPFSPACFQSNCGRAVGNFRCCLFFPFSYLLLRVSLGAFLSCFPYCFVFSWNFISLGHKDTTLKGP